MNITNIQLVQSVDLDDDLNDFFTSNTTQFVASAASPISSNSSTGTPKRRGWPLRHCRRVHWYRVNLLGIYQKIQQQTFFGPNRKGDLDNKLWTQHEIDTFNNILEQLRDLYNNRFEEYKKMIAQEKGYEYIPSDKVNKFILK
jgi:hypothetical protein